MNKAAPNDSAISSIAEREARIVQALSGLTSWEDRYRNIISRGQKLTDLPQNMHSDDHRVRGCQSQVWLHGELKDGRIYFLGDSDALIVKGLLALLLEIYNGATPKEILESSPQVLAQMDLKAHLSPTRAGGVQAIVRQIHYYAAAFQSMVE